MININTKEPILIHDEKSFYDDIYFTFEDAVKELKKRQQDTDLINKIRMDLSEIPHPLTISDNINAVLFRQLTTPNYETRRFIHLADGGNMNPVMWEYLGDKFVSNNEFKRSLGKMKFYLGEGKKGGKIIERETIVDFNTYTGKPLNQVMCLNGESLIEFYRKLFFDAFPSFDKSFIYDGTEWFASHGKKAEDYYVNFLALFIVNGMLFENFMLNEDERWFTENIFYPSYREVCARYNLKPIIVALEPTDIEGDEFWMCHTPEHYKYVVQ